MDISISINAYPVYMQPLNFHKALLGQKGSIPQKQRRRHSPPKIVIIMYLHWNMCFVKYFQNCNENRCNSNAPVFSQYAGCIHLCMEWSGHLWCTFGFYYLLHWKCWKAKTKRVQLTKPILITYLVTTGCKYRNKMQVYVCNIVQAFSFKMTL